MKSDKEIKKEFKLEASKNPEKYYATTVLESEGFMRKQCACKTFFWTVNADQNVCGDAECSGGFRLFENNPCKKQLSYVQVWAYLAASITVPCVVPKREPRRLSNSSLTVRASVS